MTSLLDRAIAAVAPRLALQRARDRLAIGAMAGLSGYQAAKRDRAATRNWAVRPRVADQEVLPGLEEQRARSREMLRNAPLAVGAVNTVVTNVVGEGLRVSAQPDRATLAARAGITPEQAAAFGDAAEREWKLFCRREHCDSTGQLGFADLQELAFRAVLESGDVFVAMVRPQAPGPYDFSLQLIEADRVSNPNRRPDGEQVAGGVELGAAGRPIAYHVAELPRASPSGPHDWRRLPATAPDGTPRVLHLRHMLRIGQSRGVPYLSPVITALKDIDRYTDAEITAAILNACVAIMGESPTGASPLKAEAQAASAGAGGPPGSALSRTDIEFESGLVLEGFMPGEKLQSFGPARPNAGFDPFVQAILRQVGVALELPFEVLVKHFTASYSAAKAALLQAWAFFRKRRAWLAGALCQPVYEMVLANAVARGRLVAPGFDDPMLRAAWCAARWTGPSPGQLDSLKEVNAAEKRLALRLSTRTRETAELTGDDWDSVAAEFAGEEALMAGLNITPAPPVAPIGHNGGPPLEPEEDPGETGDLEQPEAA